MGFEVMDWVQLALSVAERPQGQGRGTDRARHGRDDKGRHAWGGGYKGRESRVF